MAESEGRVRLIGIALLAVAAACAGQQPVPAVVEAPPVEAMPVAEAPPNAEAKEEPLQVFPAAPEEPSAPVVEVVVPPAAAQKIPAAAKPATPAAKAPEKVAVIPQAPPAPAPAAKAPEPTLDVADLKARLRETKAFGMMTKIALQNQMDDLVKQFRAAHEGGKGTSVATLRAPFDALVAKVVGLLQAGDASLARAIGGSREAIWDILSDPEKFDAAT
jgi:hypothetical protein